MRHVALYVGVTLGILTLLGCESSALPGSASKTGGRIRMPVLRTANSPPLASVHFFDADASARYSVVHQVYPNGQVLVSVDKREGGRPFTAGWLSMDQLEQLKAELLRTIGSGTNGIRAYGPDGDYVTITVIVDGDMFTASSWHELVDEPNLVCSQRGIHRLQPGESADDYSWSAEYRAFRDNWSALRRVLEEQIPDAMSPVTDLEFRTVRLRP